MTITIGLAEQSMTRNMDTPPGFADPVLQGMNVTLVISYEGKVIKTISKNYQDFSGGQKVDFKTRLVAGQTYDLSAWADFGKGHYTLHTTKGDSAYAEWSSASIKTLQSDFVYNQYDAYFGNVRKQIMANDIILLTLKRPFALVKVNTLDWNEEAVQEAGIRPTNYATTFHVATRVRLVDGHLSQIKDVPVAGYVSEYDQDGDIKELSFDYLLADTVASILPDFVMSYQQADKVITSYTMTNIPIQRNYRTIISGNVLTKEGTIEIAVDSVWYQPDFNKSM